MKIMCGEKCQRAIIAILIIVNLGIIAGFLCYAFIPRYISKCRFPDLPQNHPLSEFKSLFDRFAKIAPGIKGTYLGKDERPRPYKVKLPEIPAENIDDKIKLLVTDVLGPESLAISGDKAYTGAEDGYVYEIDLTDLEAVTSKKLTTVCSEEVQKCRPLGMRITKDGKRLYFADAAGLCVYDYESATTEILLKQGTVIDGKPLTLPNDIDLLEEAGIIYLSDGSTKYDNSRILRGTLLHDNNGRVIKYNIETKESSTLVMDLSFPNGLQSSPDGQSLIINEFNKQRCLMLNLTTESYTVLTERLPGEPDNIRPSSDEGYWIGMNLARQEDQMSFYDFISDKGCLSEQFIEINDYISEYLSFIAKMTNRDSYQDAHRRLSSYQFISELASHSGSIVKINKDGQIIKRYVSEKYGFFSQITEYKNGLLIASDRSPQLLFAEGLVGQSE